LTRAPGFELRRYGEADEEGWVRCRVLAFLDSAFFDDVRRTHDDVLFERAV